MSKRTIIIAGVLIVIGAGLLIAPRFVFKKEATTTNTDATQQSVETQTTATTAFPLDENTTVALTKQADLERNFAFQKAKEWRDDVTFIAVTAHYDKNIDPIQGKNTYVFFSPSLGDFYWTITIDQEKNSRGENDFERVIYYRDDYILPAIVIALPIQYWKLSYVDALKKADELGGRDVRRVYSEYEVNAILSAQEDRYLTWDVEYLIEGKNVFSAAINAFDGSTQ